MDVRVPLTFLWIVQLAIIVIPIQQKADRQAGRQAVVLTHIKCFHHRIFLVRKPTNDPTMCTHPPKGTCFMLVSERRIGFQFVSLGSQMTAKVEADNQHQREGENGG